MVQWTEAVNGDWIDHEESRPNDILVTYQTEKGGDHLVRVYFPKETWKGMKLLVDPNTRSLAGVSPKNEFVFASTNNSDTNNRHAINDILKGLDNKKQTSRGDASGQVAAL